MFMYFLEKINSTKKHPSESFTLHNLYCNFFLISQIGKNMFFFSRAYRREAISLDYKYKDNGLPIIKRR
jgi:hypothetical protein